MSDTLDRAALKRNARELLRTAQVSPKGMTALYCGLTVLLNVLDYLAGTLLTGGGAEAFSLFVSIFTTLFSWILAAGFAIYCMGIRRREIMGYGTLFDGLSFTAKIIALVFVMSFFIFLWSLLFVIPGFIAVYRYRFALYNLYDNPSLGILEALDLSKRQTLGWKLELFKLDLSYLGWNLLASLPSLYWDFKLYFQVLSDPSAVLTVSTSLTEILVCGVWSLAVSLFYLPGWQCVMLDYFDAARAASSGGKAALPEEGPDDSEGF